MHKITLQAQKEVEAFASLQEHAAQKPLIIIIDDSPTVRKIVETCLGREGFEVQGFQDGMEALNWLAEPESRFPQLVILDIGLPNMDGYALARYFKSRPRFRETAIVMLTRRDGVVDRLKGRLAGAQAYLTKPFTTQQLISVVQAHLGLAASTQEGGESHDLLRS
jgi:twitching motility two-component system response regulator PilG